MKLHENKTLFRQAVQFTADQMAILFERDRTVIVKHIANVFLEGELDEISNVQKMHIPNSDKPVKLYNQDVIISVGYRVKSQRGTQFRIWATQRLKEYIVKGFTMDALKTWVVVAIGKNCCNASEIFVHPKKCFIGKCSTFMPQA